MKVVNPTGPFSRNLWGEKIWRWGRGFWLRVGPEGSTRAIPKRATGRVQAQVRGRQRGKVRGETTTLYEKRNLTKYIFEGTSFIVADKDTNGIGSKQMACTTLHNDNQ